MTTDRMSYDLYKPADDVDDQCIRKPSNDEDGEIKNGESEMNGRLNRTESQPMAINIEQVVDGEESLRYPLIDRISGKKFLGQLRPIASATIRHQIINTHLLI